VKVGYYEQLPIRANFVNQRKHSVQNGEKKNVSFQQVLAEQQTEQQNSNYTIDKERTKPNELSSENELYAALLQNEMFNTEWMMLFINSLFTHTGTNEITSESLFTKKFPALLEDTFPVLLEDTLPTLLKDTFPALLEDTKVKSLIQDLITKWQVTKENSELEINTLLSNESLPKQVDRLLTTDSLENLTAGKWPNIVGNMEINDTLLSTNQSVSALLQHGNIHDISLSETAPKQIVSQQFSQQLLDIIHGSKFTRMGNGQSQLVIRLHPEHLGFLTIKLVQENGELTAKIITSTVSAKELIEANIQQIRHAIPAQNITIEKFDVFTQQPSDFGFREQQRESREQPHSQQERQESSKRDNTSDFKDAFATELLNLKV
jgi:flagellar hook-length control protein FliK